ncbi:hypothetical protein BB561_002395 [Smittium simulii]|uniref:FHA domain-containing protein n=1 Tax=Smittium simulii TaxID=133385 RepID=A0A2T9YQI4_9FUNG|nr:hypothetical protein BB561_002395 [Smittium simulii]
MFKTPSLTAAKKKTSKTTDPECSKKNISIPVSLPSNDSTTHQANTKNSPSAGPTPPSLKKNTQYPPLNYTPPQNRAEPARAYTFDVLKNGSLLETLAISIEQDYFVVGRLPNCDFPLDHPSISRYHAVIQFCKNEQAFIYDLGSTHKTFINKKELSPRKLHLIQLGDQIRFGLSQRIFIFSTVDNEHLDDISQKIENKYNQAKALARQKLNKEIDSLGSATISHDPKFSNNETENIWGFGEDAVDTDIVDINSLPETPNNNNAFYSSDPRAALNFQKHKINDFESLSKDHDVLLETIKRIETEKLNLEQKNKCIDSIRNSSKEMAGRTATGGSEDGDQDSEIDEIDLYVLQLQNDTDRDMAQKLETQLEELKKKLGEIKDLLEIAKPVKSSELIKSVSKVPEIVKSSASGSVNQAGLKCLVDDGEKTKKRSVEIEPSKPRFPSSLTKTSEVFDKESDNRTDLQNEKDTSNNRIDLQNGKDTSEDQNTVKIEAKKRKIGPTMLDENTNTKTAVEQSEYDMYQAEEINWAPPSNQTGDGRTHLNDKYGY